jgi:hypothetical protein
MGITLEQAKALRPGKILHHTINRNADGTPQRWRVSGQPKVWVRSPQRVKVPVKHGLYVNDYITETNLDLVSLPEDWILFRDLELGDEFDFVDDANPSYNSFHDRCLKVSSRKYESKDTQEEYRVGSINVRVYHIHRSNDL